MYTNERKCLRKQKALADYGRGFILVRGYSLTATSFSGAGLLPSCANEALEAYQEAQAAYSALHGEVFDQDHTADKSTVQAIINALHGVQDLEMEYIYRLGVQEGMRMLKPEFITEGIGQAG